MGEEDCGSRSLEQCHDGARLDLGLVRAQRRIAGAQQLVEKSVDVVGRLHVRIETGLGRRTPSSEPPESKGQLISPNFWSDRYGCSSLPGPTLARSIDHVDRESASQEFRLEALAPVERGLPRRAAAGMPHDDRQITR